MSHGILLNKFIAEINYKALDSDFDIYRISCDSEKFYKSDILDIPKADFKALSVQYSFGKNAYVLFKKGAVAQSVFRLAVQEKFEDAAVTKVDISSRERCHEEKLYDNLLIQLLANSVKVPVIDEFSYNNLTGKLYYLTPEWTKKNSFYALEIIIERDLTIVLKVRTFRAKQKDDNRTGLVFDKTTGELRKKLSSDKKLTEFVQKGFPNKRNKVNFLNFTSYDKFYRSKLGVLKRFLKDMQSRFGGYVTLTQLESENTIVFDIPKSRKDDEQWLIHGRLLDNKVTITDEVKNEISQDLISKIQHELNHFYKIDTAVGAIDLTGNNIRIIHDQEYYEKNKLTDEHTIVPEGAVVQHLMIEQDIHIKSNTKDDPSPDIKKIIEELIIKRDIQNGKITIFDWQAQGFERDVYFAIRNKIKKPEQSEESGDNDKAKTNYKYNVLSISLAGELSFKQFTDEEMPSGSEADIIIKFENFKNKYAKYPNQLEGLIWSDMDNTMAIVRTTCTTMPNIHAISDSLEEKKISKETVLEAIAEFKEQFPKYSDYADGVFDQMSLLTKIDKATGNKCLDYTHHRNAARALNGFIYSNYGIRINSEIKARANDDEYFMDNVCGIKYYHEKLWDGSEVISYYVGTKRRGLKFSIHNACSVRKVYAEQNVREFTKLFPLMSVEFVRSYQHTVIPFPFKYLREVEI